MKREPMRRTPARRGTAPRWVALLAAFLALPMALAGCSLKTIGAPKGGTTIYATFDDAQNLVAGHSVQMADVKVGSVTAVKLTGYKARVTISLKPGVKLPKGTSAEVAVTSLLGENFVRLSLPSGGSMQDGQMMADGDQITQTSMQPQFEQIVGKAGPLLDALANDDVGAVVNAGATALDGNGERLNKAIAESSDLVKIFGDQRAQLATSVDQLAKLGRSLAKGGDELGKAPGQLEKTTWVLNENKNKILQTVEKISRMARLLNDKVLATRVQKLRNLLLKLDPVLAELGGNRARLTNVINGLVKFSDRLPKATYDGQLLLYPILKFINNDGSTFPNSTGLTKVKLPKGIDTALPKIDRVVGGGQ